MTRMRIGGIKRGESNLASNSSLCALHSLESSESFTELHREEKREEGDRGEQEEKRGNQKERERDLGSTLFPKCSPQPGTQRFPEFCREEKGDGGDRGVLGDKKESQKGERVIKPVITLLSKNAYLRLDS